MRIEKMLISKLKLDTLLEVMTTEKARRAVQSWAVQRGRVTFDTLGELDNISDEDLIGLRRFVNIAVAERGILDDHL